MLTTKQSQILDFIRSYVCRRGLMPTLQEIGDNIGVAHRGNISRHLSALISKGYLQRTKGQRGFVLTDSSEMTSFELPLAGKIAAGCPIEAIQGEDRVNLYDTLLGPDRYLLLVEGDSMIEAGIFDGDLVVIHQQDNADDGDIVVALIDEQEVTLKRLKKLNHQQIQLCPENTQLKALSYSADRVRIQGKLVAQLRTYK